MERGFIIFFGIGALVSAVASFGMAMKLWSEPRPVQLPQAEFISVVSGKIVSVDPSADSLRIRIENDMLFPDMNPVSTNGAFEELVYLDKESQIVTTNTVLKDGVVSGYTVNPTSRAVLVPGAPIQIAGTYKKANGYRYTANSITFFPEFFKSPTQ